LGYHDFDGSSQYLSRAAAVLTGDPVTHHCAFRPDRFTAEEALLAVAVNGQSYRYQLSHRGDQSGDPVYAVSQGGGYQEAVASNGTGSTAWYYAAAIFPDDSERTVYLDGTTVNDTGGNGPAAMDRTYLGCDGFGGSPNHFFDGRIGEARIADSALSTTFLDAWRRNLSAPGSYISAGTPESVGGGSTYDQATSHGAPALAAAFAAETDFATALAGGAPMLSGIADATAGFAASLASGGATLGFALADELTVGSGTTYDDSTDHGGPALAFALAATLTPFAWAVAAAADGNWTAAAAADGAWTDIDPTTATWTDD
jgi:hypothetical protein